MSDDSLLSPKDASSNSTRLKVKRRSRRRRDASGGAAPASHNDNLLRRTSSNSSASKISTNSQRENPREKLFLAEDIPLLSDVRSFSIFWEFFLSLCFLFCLWLFPL